MDVSNAEIQQELTAFQAETRVILASIKDELVEVKELGQRVAENRLELTRQDERWSAHIREHEGLATKEALARLGNNVASGTEAGQKALNLAHKNEITTTRLMVMIGSSAIGGSLVTSLITELVKALVQKP